MNITTKETQYTGQVRDYQNTGPISLGSTGSWVWRNDPKRLTFLLSRYKFVSRILSRKKNILEVGCGDGFGSRIVSQSGAKVTCSDFDPIFVDEAAARDSWDKNRNFQVADFLKGSLPGSFDGAYLLDVIEHIPASEEDIFLNNIKNSLVDSAICVIGAPSLESQPYASIPSKEGHINCKTGSDLESLVAKYFENVLMFGMNDEVVHTGFYKMSHYLFAVGIGRKI